MQPDDGRSAQRLRFAQGGDVTGPPGSHDAAGMTESDEQEINPT